MEAQLREHRSVGEAEVAHDEVTLSPGGGPFCAQWRGRRDMLPGLRGADAWHEPEDRGAQRPGDAQANPDNSRPDYDPLRPDFIEVEGGFPALTGGTGGACCCTFVRSGTA
jgi:hypothetical protein